MPLRAILNRGWVPLLGTGMLCLIAGMPPAAANDAADYFRDREELSQLIEAGDVAAAYEIARSLNRRDSRDAMQWWAEGWLAAELRDWDSAAVAYTHAFRLGSLNQAVAARRIAEAHAHAGRDEQALRWLRRALACGLDGRFLLADNDAFARLRDDARFVEITGLASALIDDRTERWRHDIDFLVAEARRLHAGPERPAFGDSFAKAATALKKAVPSSTDTELMLGLQRLVVMLGDAHSYLMVGRVHDKGTQPPQIEDRSLPVFLHPFEDDVHIINAKGDATRLIGSRIVAFGDLPIDDFITAAAKYQHRDNDETWKFIGVQFLYRSMALHRVLGTASDDGVEVTAESADGKRTTMLLPAGRYSFPRKLRPMPGQQRIPMFLQHVDTVYRRDFLPELDAVYLQVNNIRNAEDGPSLERFAAQSVDEALQRQASKLIVDFRLNNGGNNNLCQGLLDALSRFEILNERGRIFVLTRHETFSAAQNCSTRIEAMTDAVFVGEPSSSRPNFTGEETLTLLPYSGFLVSFSNRYWQDAAPTDHRQWIAPDIPAPLTFDAYANGKDPALAAISELQ